MIKKRLFLLLFAFALILNSLYAIPLPLPKTMEGIIVSADSYGNLIPSFNAKDLKNAGYDYGDILNVDISGVGLFKMPFVTNYLEVSAYSPAVCDFNGRGGKASIFMGYMNFAESIGGGNGDAVEITLHKKGGYLEEYNKGRLIFINNRANYLSDEEYTNFREVKTGNLAPKTLYRCSTPCNVEFAGVRHTYCDKLCWQNRIRTVVNLADSDLDIERYLESADYKAPYYKALYKTGNVLNLSLPTVFFGDTFTGGVAKAVRFILDRKPPYLIHCNEGKDRTGLVCLVFSSLTGASIDEVRKDYLRTFEVCYGMKKGSYQHERIRKNFIDRFIYVMGHPELANSITKIKWEKVDISNINLEKAARKYLSEACGLSNDEINKLKAKLQGN